MITLTTTNQLNENPLDPNYYCALYIQDLATFLQNQPANPVRSNNYNIIWVQRGKGTYWIDLKKFALSDNTVYCLHPGQLSVFNEVQSMEGILLSFSASFISHLKEDINILNSSGLFNAYMLNPITLSGDEIQHVLKTLRREYEGKNELRVEVLRSLVRILIIQLSRCYQTCDMGEIKMERDVQLVNTFLELVHKHYAEKKKVADYAAELLIAPNYLNIKVKRISGYTASYHIQQRILLEAKRQARWAGMNLKQIAYTLGFDDIAHFSKFFKRAAGISFSEFKRGKYML
ncbi:helix-turn-helix domain-containing protein [Chitinophaga sp.]|uniref:helix-turn-helix domain-containing protein n=1 Tax=Chitinophaga sp. TaxID=1869181 RepID=UPI0031D33753